MPPYARVARGWMERYLRRHGFAAVAMPWKRVYVLFEYRNRPEIYAHELVHFEQIDRHGAIMFTILYLWWSLRYGYEKNPFEVEAYSKAPVQ